MATFTAIQCKKQSASSMRGVIDYVEQEKKTRWGDAHLVVGQEDDISGNRIYGDA